MRALLVAVGFLTRIPVPVRVFETDHVARSRSLAWYPVVGLLIGAMLAVLAWCLRDAPPLLVGGPGSAGLGGTDRRPASGWIGRQRRCVGWRYWGIRVRTLAIMKDPRCGPAGVVALVLVLLMKVAALASLPPGAFVLLPLAPLLARAALTLAFATTPYVREAGLGTALVAAPRVASWAGVLASAGLCLVFGWSGAIALATAVLVFALWRRGCMRRIGGTTGDTAGALAELVEAAVLVAIVLSPANTGFGVS